MRSRAFMMPEQFQSTLPAWGATRHVPDVSCRSGFQSTLPAWGATTVNSINIITNVFQSTLPAWGATSSSLGARTFSVFQSTLPAWGATCCGRSRPPSARHFNPRSPRGERPVPLQTKSFTANFNPRSPRGERLIVGLPIPARLTFQSTLPAWGATASSSSSARTCIVFQSTLPAWGATMHLVHFLVRPPISIHAPRVGSDVCLA